MAAITDIHQGGGRECKLRLQKMRCKKMQINANKCKKKCNPTTDAHTEQFDNRFSTTMDGEGPSKSLSVTDLLVEFPLIRPLRHNIINMYHSPFGNL